MIIELGDKVKEVVTGFEGVVTGRAEYLTGCTQFCVTPPVKDGAIVDSVWFDETRLRVNETGAALRTTLAKEPTKAGGPQANAPRGRH